MACLWILKCEREVQQIKFCSKFKFLNLFQVFENLMLYRAEFEKNEQGVDDI